MLIGPNIGVHSPLARKRMKLVQCDPSSFVNKKMLARRPECLPNLRLLPRTSSPSFLLGRLVQKPSQIHVRELTAKALIGSRVSSSRRDMLEILTITKEQIEGARSAMALMTRRYNFVGSWRKVNTRFDLKFILPLRRVSPCEILCQCFICQRKSLCSYTFVNKGIKKYFSVTTAKERFTY
ncbi:hypothetical protein AVEN_167914-1 [Araneus ventricosus]|uniref:Uncharacterized protein n=1 Tax=Araneus ventricosus TaxID=182803 RepID=A0A4Y2FYE3_ARAVE|nr:hypothetical protein AVEN_167914-1 [Araneus ventricosus]